MQGQFLYSLFLINLLLFLSILNNVSHLSYTFTVSNLLCLIVSNALISVKRLTNVEGISHRFWTWQFSMSLTVYFFFRSDRYASSRINLTNVGGKHPYYFHFAHAVLIRHIFSNTIVSAYICLKRVNVTL